MLDYEVVCYRVMWRSEKEIEWHKSDFTQEEIAYKLVKEILQVKGFEVKLLKILGACI